MIKKNITPDTEIVFGVHAILELLKAKKRKLLAIYTTKPTPKAWNMIEPLLAKHVLVHYVPRESLNRLAQSDDHQGIVGFASPFIIQKKMFSAEKQPFLLMLDGIQDPRNLGAILRSAYCTNIDGVIIVKKNSAPLNGTTLKAAAGLAENLNIMLAPSAQVAVEMLKKENYSIYMSVLQNGTSAAAISYRSPLCLVIGGEGYGITQSVRKDGVLITLPQKNPDISYNASVATGILLFLIAQQIQKI